MTDKPTPGPWNTYQQDTGSGYFIRGHQGVCVARCLAETDARLIAAAPDLLAENSELKHDNKLLMQANADLATENKRLEAENARLREALEEVPKLPADCPGIASLLDETKEETE